MKPENPNGQWGRIKLSAHISPTANDREIDFFAQFGIPYAYTWMNDLAGHKEVIASLKQRLADRGVTLYNAGDMLVSKSAAIHLGTPERDRVIDRFIQTLEALSELGIRTTTFTWEPDQVWSTGKAAGRGGAECRFVDENQLAKEAFTHGRAYPKDELWENFAYFMKRIIPAAERTGVRLALHPNDPPMASIAGVDCLITSFEDYEKAFSIAGSKYLGMEFCCGCWLEGGERFGDVIRAIKEFVRDGRVFVTHFRNISAPLPVFHETFLDDGYMDMFRLMQAFYEADYDGTLIYDHTPSVTAGKQAAEAYAIGYIKALMNTASRKVAGVL